MDKCCLDKYHRDSWNPLRIVQGTYLKKLVKIESVTAEILWTLSLCGWGGVGWFAQSFSCSTSNYSWVEVTLQLSWGFDNFFGLKIQLTHNFLDIFFVSTKKILGTKFLSCKIFRTKHLVLDQQKTFGLKSFWTKYLTYLSA